MIHFRILVPSLSRRGYATPFENTRENAQGRPRASSIVAEGGALGNISSK